MADKTFTAFFDSYVTAAEAVSRLEAAGVPHDDIAILSNDPAHGQHISRWEEQSGTATGASLGTLLGGGAGLLAGLGTLAIPGLGPIVAAGWLASTLVGAGVGAAAGGLVGALTESGVSDDEAQAYAEGVHRGGTLVTVRADESRGVEIDAILKPAGTMDIKRRANDWRDEESAGRDDGREAVLIPPLPPVVPILPRGTDALATEPDPDHAEAKVRSYDTTI